MNLFVDGLESPGGFCEAICTLLQTILVVLKVSGGCCESIIDGLESPRGCCVAICTLLQRNINGSRNCRRLL